MTLEKVDPEITEILMPDEEIILVASQSKVAPGGTLSAPNKVYITNNRVLFKDPKWFGLKANIIDIGYQDISTVILKRGVFTTEIYLKPRFSPHKIELPAVDKRVAQHASILIQKGMKGELIGQKKKTKETREQQRPSVDERQNDIIIRLEKLADMRARGLLTDQEFQIMKEELLLTLKPEVHYDDNNNSAGAAELELLHRKEVPDVGIAEKPKDSLSCRYCNFTNVPFGSKFCPECGKGVIEDTNIWKMCPGCDALMTDDSVFCASCNQKFPETLR